MYHKKIMEDIAGEILDAYSQCMEPDLRIEGSKSFDYSSFLRVAGRHAAGMWKVQSSAVTTIGCDVRAYEAGSGSLCVMAWSQMHGNEPVSTLALLDVMNFVESGGRLAVWLRSRYRMVMIPLLNPEGHQLHNRRNAMGIDINRDAQDLVSPEARFLMREFQLTGPDLALNLHDQEDTYTPGPSRYQTLISLLAPECGCDGSVTPCRERAMGVCASVGRMLQGLYPDRISRYQDSYTPTAFGDTFMRMGASAVLIEAGAYQGDRLRTVARKAMFLSIIAAMVYYGLGRFRPDGYGSLPVNCRDRVFLLRMRGLRINTPGGGFSADIGIRRVKTSLNPEDFADCFGECRVMGIGNLDSMAAEYEFDARGYTLVGGCRDMYVTRPADFCIADASGRIVCVKNLIANY